MYTKTNQQSGFALFDAIIGMAITALLISAFLGGIYQAQTVTSQARQKLIASQLMLETYEVGVALAKEDFTNISNAYTGGCATGPCHVSNSSGNWLIQTGSSTVDSHYETGFTLFAVHRNGSNDIATPGTLDGLTFEMRIQVAWNDRGATTTEELVTYIHDINPGP